MAFIAADKDGKIALFVNKPVRNTDENPAFCYWSRHIDDNGRFANVSKRICRDIIGKVLTWDDKPVKL
jgi:hypothetical protein